MSINKSVKRYFKGKKKHKVKLGQRMWDLEMFLLCLFFIGKKGNIKDVF